MYPGWSVLCSQFNVHHRCPVQARTGSERRGRRLYANPDPYHEQLPLP